MLPPVHAEGAQRGSKVPGATFWVPGGNFCPQKRPIPWRNGPTSVCLERGNCREEDIPSAAICTP